MTWEESNSEQSEQTRMSDLDQDDMQEGIYMDKDGVEEAVRGGDDPRVKCVESESEAQRRVRRDMQRRHLGYDVDPTVYSVNPDKVDESNSE